jgi:hypothetical protein
MSELQGWADEIVSDIMKEQVQSFVQYLKYELDALNSEVAMNSGRHGYDYKTIPMQVINSVQAIKSGSNYVVSIPEQYVVEMNDKMVGLLELAMNNALIRFGADGGE